MGAGRGLLALGLTLAACGSGVEPPGAEALDAGPDATDAGPSCQAGGHGDWDCDGFGPLQSGGADCDDFDADVNPAAAESPEPRLVARILTDWGTFQLDDVARADDGTLQVLFQDLDDPEEGPYVGSLIGGEWSTDALHLGHVEAARFAPGSTLQLSYARPDGLYYATMSEGVLDEEVVGEGAPVCMGVDAEARPVIGGTSLSAESGLRSAFVSRRGESGWTTQTFADGVSATECAVDTTGTMHALFMRSERLVYLVEQAGAWETDHPAGEVSQVRGLMALQPQGVAHLLIATNRVEHLVETPDGWLTELVPGEGIPWAAATDESGSFAAVLTWWDRPNYTAAFQEDAAWRTVPLPIERSQTPFLRIDRGFELIDLEEEDPPTDCGKCPRPRLRLRYTALGAADENCDGAAE